MLKMGGQGSGKIYHRGLSGLARLLDRPHESRVESFEGEAASSSRTSSSLVWEKSA
jgi:hypothetical protein